MSTPLEVATEQVQPPKRRVAYDPLAQLVGRPRDPAIKRRVAYDPLAPLVEKAKANRLAKSRSVEEMWNNEAQDAGEVWTDNRTNQVTSPPVIEQIKSAGRSALDYIKPAQVAQVAAPVQPGKLNIGPLPGYIKVPPAPTVQPGQLNIDPPDAPAPVEDWESKVLDPQNRAKLYAARNKPYSPDGSDYLDYKLAAIQPITGAANAAVQVPARLAQAVADRMQKSTNPMAQTIMRTLKAAGMGDISREGIDRAIRDPNTNGAVKFILDQWMLLAGPSFSDYMHGTPEAPLGIPAQSPGGAVARGVSDIATTIGEFAPPSLPFAAGSGLAKLGGAVVKKLGGGKVLGGAAKAGGVITGFEAVKQAPGFISGETPALEYLQHTLGAFPQMLVDIAKSPVGLQESLANGISAVSGDDQAGLIASINEGFTAVSPVFTLAALHYLGPHRFMAKTAQAKQAVLEGDPDAYRKVLSDSLPANFSGREGRTGDVMAQEALGLPISKVPLPANEIAAGPRGTLPDPSAAPDAALREIGRQRALKPIMPKIEDALDEAVSRRASEARRPIPETKTGPVEKTVQQPVGFEAQQTPENLGLTPFAASFMRRIGSAQPDAKGVRSAKLSPGAPFDELISYFARNNIRARRDGNVLRVTDPNATMPTKPGSIQVGRAVETKSPVDPAGEKSNVKEEKSGPAQLQREVGSANRGSEGGRPRQDQGIIDPSEVAGRRREEGQGIGQRGLTEQQPSLPFARSDAVVEEGTLPSRPRANEPSIQENVSEKAPEKVDAVRQVKEGRAQGGVEVGRVDAKQKRQQGVLGPEAKPPANEQVAGERVLDQPRTAGAIEKELSSHELNAGYGPIRGKKPSDFRAGTTRARLANLREADVKWNQLNSELNRARQSEQTKSTKADNINIRKEAEATAESGDVTREAVVYAPLHKLQPDVRKSIQDYAGYLLTTTKSESVKKALEKIVRDAGEDTGAEVEKQKGRIIDRLTGDAKSPEMVKGWEREHNDPLIERIIGEKDPEKRRKAIEDFVDQRSGDASFDPIEIEARERSEPAKKSQEISTERVRSIADAPVDAITTQFLDKYKGDRSDWKAVMVASKKFASEAMTKTGKAEGPSVRLGSEIEQRSADAVLKKLFGKTESQLREPERLLVEEKSADPIAVRDAVDSLFKRDRDSGQTKAESVDDFVFHATDSLSRLGISVDQAARAGIIERANATGMGHIAKWRLAKPTGEQLDVQKRPARQDQIGSSRVRPPPPPPPPSSAEPFLSSMEPMAKAKASKALEVNMLNDGVLRSRKDIVERMVSEGATIVVAKNGERRLQRTNGAYLAQSQITKTGMDYAGHLLKKDTAALPESGTGGLHGQRVISEVPLTGEQKNLSMGGEDVTVKPEKAAPVKPDTPGQTTLYAGFVPPPEVIKKAAADVASAGRSVRDRLGWTRTYWNQASKHIESLTKSGEGKAYANLLVERDYQKSIVAGGMHLDFSDSIRGLNRREAENMLLSADRRESPMNKKVAKALERFREADTMRVAMMKTAGVVMDDGTTFVGRDFHMTQEWNEQARKEVRRGNGPLWQKAVKIVADQLKRDASEREKSRTDAQWVDGAKAWLKRNRRALTDTEPTLNLDEPAVKSRIEAETIKGVQLRRKIQWPREFLAKDLVEAEIRHIDQIASAVANARVLGPKVERLQKAYRETLKQVEEEAEASGTKDVAQTIEIARRLLKGVTGRAMNIEKLDLATYNTPRPVRSAIRGGTRMSALWHLGPASAFGTLVNPIWGTAMTLYRFGTVRTLTNTIKNLPLAAIDFPLVGRAVARLPAYRKAVRAGVLEAAGLTSLVDEAPMHSAKKSVIKALVASWEPMLRATAMVTGESWANSAIKGLARRVRNNPKKPAFDVVMNTSRARKLVKMGLTEQQVIDAAKRGKFSEDEISRLRIGGVAISQFMARPLDLPFSWTSPAGRLFTQFWSMAYKQSQNTVGDALSELGHGNLIPIARLLPIAIASGWAAQNWRNFLYGRADEDEDGKNKVAKFLSYLGDGLGIIDRPIELVTTGEVTKNTLQRAITPVAVSDAISLVSNASKAIRDQMKEDAGEKKPTTAYDKLRPLARSSGTGKTIDAYMARRGVVVPHTWKRNAPYSPATKEWYETVKRLEAKIKASDDEFAETGKRSKEGQISMGEWKWLEKAKKDQEELSTTRNLVGKVEGTREAKSAGKPVPKVYRLTPSQEKDARREIGDKPVSSESFSKRELDFYEREVNNLPKQKKAG